MHKTLLKIYIYDFFVRHETVYNMCSILLLQHSEGYSGVLYRFSIHISVVYILRSLNLLKGGNFQPERRALYNIQFTFFLLLRYIFCKSHVKCECSCFVKYNVKNIHTPGPFVKFKGKPASWLFFFSFILNTCMCHLGSSFKNYQF